ncbi:MAG TPA: VanW family protein, partial [Candidatus Limnocylindrales bacterium]|nr:VanW family protein [Candidatus Limnocylindrales bacterium]
MTTQAEVADQPRIELRTFSWRRAAVWFIVTMLAIVFFAAAFAAGYGRFHEGRVLPGVDVAGVDVAGLNRAAAEAKLRRALPNLGAGALAVSVDGAESEVAYSEIGRDYDMELMLDEAFGVGRTGVTSEQLQEQMRTLLNGLSIAPVVNWDAEELAERVAAIATAAESNPVDATITRVGSEYVVTPSEEGAAVDEHAAVAAAMAALHNVSAADTEIEVETTAIAPQIPTEVAQAAADSANQVMAESLTLSALGGTARIDPETIAGWTRLEETAPGEWEVVIEQAPIEQIVDSFKFAVDVPATNATYSFEESQPVVIPDAGGQEIDREAAISAAMSALHGRADGTPTSSLNLAITPLAPEFTAAQAQALVSRIERLSRWTTKYDPSSRNGNGQNIRRPTNLIDGYVVEPGATFDFVEVAGPITAANGYTSGAAIIHGNTQLDGVLGGGLCSCSTTLFNAALRAGFEMGARRNHAYYIDRYPVGLDATIWINGRYVQTMSFTNDSEYPILIRGINRSNSVTFEIYGVPDGRTVDLSKARVWAPKEAWTRVEYTTDLPPGASERVEYPFDGFQSSVTRTVRSATGAILHEDTYQSSYRRVIGHILVGWQPGDPPP